DSVERLQAIVNVRDFHGAHDATTLIDPHGRRHIDHVIEPRHEMLCVDEHCEFRLCGLNPLAGVSCTTRVLCYRDDLEVPVLQFAVQFLPSRQVETASSPGCPGHEQHLLATKLGERPLPAIHIRQREVWRYKRTEIRILLLGSWSEIPHRLFSIVGCWLA